MDLRGLGKKLTDAKTAPKTQIDPFLVFEHEIKLPDTIFKPKWTWKIGWFLILGDKSQLGTSSGLKKGGGGWVSDGGKISQFFAKMNRNEGVHHLNHVYDPLLAKPTSVSSGTED